ncbi:MAG: acetyl-CoA carboxylase biotin carboxylase subunit [Candidatus Omnitrophica bacterium]|nr:acetyl-CoA carboxylase biotin carboxylase subunit [Candidatus Omnitrophota bacterium]
MLKRVFIPNRGEIAVRIIRSCKELGITSILGFSEADRFSLATMIADEKICIGPPSPLDSYLNIPAILSAMEVMKVDSVHPGYGFLSENPFFVEVCDASRIVFIGPGPEQIRLMGDKSEARRTVKKNRLPVIPGVDSLTDLDDAKKQAKKIGFPVMIKASAGGGGRGMRIARNIDEFCSFWPSCQQEAKIAFDNPSLYIEKFIERPRHIEIQVLADEYGNILVFPERDCSLQRRHQKLIEETPSPVVEAGMRKKLQKIARKICKAIKYKNAGTIEFLMGGRHAYFMEMNTRIQVEHPITEMITGFDLVKSQIEIASGEKIRFPHYFVPFTGHSIECRINAEDPEKDFLPSPGRITKLILPGGPGIRVDTHIFEGYVIPPYYDSLLAKVISYGRTRQEAIFRMSRALQEMKIEGVATTIDFYRMVLDHPVFQSGRYYVGWLEKILAERKEKQPKVFTS